ncbi:hypothetical protein ANTQUA_LOCUS9219 [Anthophora quadrimaculata]
MQIFQITAQLLYFRAFSDEWCVVTCRVVSFREFSEKAEEIVGYQLSEKVWQECVFQLSSGIKLIVAIKSLSGMEAFVSKNRCCSESPWIACRRRSKKKTERLPDRQKTTNVSNLCFSFLIARTLYVLS